MIYLGIDVEDVGMMKEKEPRLATMALGKFKQSQKNKIQNTIFVHTFKKREYARTRASDFKHLLAVNLNIFLVNILNLCLI